MVDKKQSAAQAVPTSNPVTPPDFFQKVIEENKQLDTQALPQDEQLFKQLSQSDEWRALKKIIAHKQQGLRDMTAEVVRKNPGNLQEVGLRYLICDQVCNALQSVISRVELPLNSENAQRLRKEDDEQPQ